MKKSFLKFLFLTFLMTMLFGMVVLAAETETPENEKVVEEIESVTNEYHSGIFYGSYTDDYYVTHYLTVNASCTASYSWDEGLSGWLTSITFNTPSVTFDGVSIPVYYYTQGMYTSFAYIEYRVNSNSSTAKRIRVYFEVDEYGVTNLGVVFNVQ